LQDAHEALVLMLRALHDGLGRTKPIPGSRALTELSGAGLEAWQDSLERGYSVIPDIFQGQLLSSLAGPGAPPDNATYEHFMSLSLPIAACDSVQQVSEASLV
jgi:ubiquitin C-terminal hydrolase